jgi:cyclophilin family peptidyl-prolyl cis-trans isomerase
VAFGRVTKGLDVLGELATMEVEPPSNHPKSRVSIVDSGCYAM